MKHLTCPFALHPDGAPLRIALADGQTRPPMTGFRQDAAAAAARHLFDALGLETRSAVSIGISTEVVEDCAIHFVLCRVGPSVRARWKHLRPDGTPVTAAWVALDAAPRNPTLDWIRGAL